jgi:hypothetical protein
VEVDDEGDDEGDDSGNILGTDRNEKRDQTIAWRI